MSLFLPSQSAQIERVNQVAEQSKLREELESVSTKSTKSINNDLSRMTNEVLKYFEGSPAGLIQTPQQLHEYVDRCIEAGIVGVDTETTGLDRTYDTIVGSSLYYPGGVEVYIPNNHIHPIFEDRYKGQLTYAETAVEFQRMVDAGVKFVFANADFDLAMINKDYKVDLLPNFYYDVILAWRCIKENEKDNSLKGLYAKYVMKNKVDPKKFTDFFTPELFPFCKPETAKLYAANDAKITYELYEWQLPYITIGHPKCQKHKLESIAKLVWDIEYPMVAVCQNLHRYGMYLDMTTSAILYKRYSEKQAEETKKLQQMVQDILDKHPERKSNLKGYIPDGKSFNPKSSIQVAYLLYDVMHIPTPKGNRSTDKEILKSLNLPVTNQILAVRSMGVLMSTFIEKLPKSAAVDGRVHGTFKSIGADTGRLSSSDPNLQNIPSKDHYIRHMFRATPGYVMLSSDYS